MDNKLVKGAHLRDVTSHLWNETKKKYIADVKVVSDIDGKKRLNKTINDKDEEVSSIVTQWNDLDYVEEKYTFKNQFNNLPKGNFVFNQNGEKNEVDRDHTSLLIPIVKGKKIRLTNKAALNQNDVNAVLNIAGITHVIEYNTEDITQAGRNTFLKEGFWSKSSDNINSRTIIEYEATHNDVKAIGVSVRGVNNSEKTEELMIWYEDEAPIPPSEYIEDKIIEHYIIDGEKVKTSFKSKTNLASPTVAEALDELNEKIGQQTAGVQSINTKSGAITLALESSDDDKVKFTISNGQGGDEVLEISSYTTADGEELINKFDTIL